MNRDEIACLCFSYLYGIGPWKFSQLMQRFNSPHNAYTASETGLKECLSDKMVRSVLSFRAGFDAKAEQRRFEAKGIHYISIINPGYPTMLREIPDPPIGLFYVGNCSLLRSNAPMIAVVGTRKPSVYGQTQAKKISGELAEQGAVVVSGMALGIDTCAHVGALLSGGKTIAVLGCGVDVVYPHSNAGLYKNIIKSGGLIISEFPPGKAVLPGLFISRNRIISGLSRGTFVVEGCEKSGSLITAAYAATQGRELFALPGQVTTEGSIAPHLLIKQGAHLVTAAGDILDELGFSRTEKTKSSLPKDLTPEEQVLYSRIQNHPHTTDELLESEALPPPTVMVTLSRLELGGIIVKTQEGLWEIA